MSADIIDIHTRSHIFQRDAEQAVAKALFALPLENVLPRNSRLIEHQTRVVEMVRRQAPAWAAVMSVAAKAWGSKCADLLLAEQSKMIEFNKAVQEYIAPPKDSA